MRKLMRWGAAASLAIAMGGFVVAVPVVATADDANTPAPVAETSQTKAGDTKAAERYVIKFDLNDPNSGLKNYTYDVDLAKQETLSQIIASKGSYQEGDIARLGDGQDYRFVRWTASNGTSNVPQWGESLQESDFGTYTEGGEQVKQIVVSAEWELAGNHGSIATSSASAYRAHGFLSNDSVNAFKTFAQSNGVESMVVDKATLNAAQQKAFDAETTNYGYEALSIVDVSMNGAAGKVDTTSADGITMRLRMYDMQKLVGNADIHDLIIWRIPDDGGTLEYMIYNVVDDATIDIMGVKATGTYVISRAKQVPGPQVPEPWSESGILPYTINNGVMTFNGRPDLGEWYQLTVKLGEGVTSVQSIYGGSGWTMTIDVCDLKRNDPLFVQQPNSGTYFVRGDGQGAYSNFLVSYDGQKALRCDVKGGGTVSRVAGNDVFQVDLSAPATLTFTTADETVVKNESGAFIEHGVTDSDTGNDAVWSSLSLVTEWLGGERAQQAASAVNAVISSVEKMFVYDIHLEDIDGSEFAVPEGDSVKVTLPLPEGMGTAGVHVFHVADDGTVTDMKGVVDAEARTITFTTTHFSTFVIAQVETNEGAESGKPTGKTDGDLPQTGDASMFMVAASAICGAGALALARKKR